MSSQPKFVPPPTGGNYIRDPDTGALTLVPDLPRVVLANPSDGGAADVASVTPTQPKKGTVK